ncbi:glycosyltransferase family 20 protein [Gigaspora rosea]|uniref:Glycosyltransferase family 20 protein n=1 Tax=Gigaspora rosea TaxID=44941 RepID=A0A397VFM1_9GLOM|nr:glycosyltransferase family 20 protein [Gigaspora rosea]
MIPYTDPQLLDNDQLKHNVKSDIYSLGVLFWELTSGVPPFQRFPQKGILLEILKGKKEIPIANTPPDYISLFYKCWSFNPENRPTLDEISLILDKLSNDTSVYFIINNINNSEIVQEDPQLMPKTSEDDRNNTSKPRLLIASHFLPLNIVKMASGYELEKSSNGLVDILNELAKSRNFIWFGQPGGCIPEQRANITEQLTKSSYYPVFIENSLIECHDNFSNLTLWPLFHYCPDDMIFCRKDWESYKIVNGLFADVINDIVQDDDLIWIHGHHLMLLPEMLRKRISNRKLNVKIGYFLHTSFPSSEIYKVLPVCEEILTSVLKSDLIGFQTVNCARHFLSSCTNTLGLLTKPNKVYYEDKYVHVGIFPIGIDPERFIGNLNEIKVQNLFKDLKEKYKDRKIIASIDQLDYIKGVPQKLHALELFLSKHPEWSGKVVLIQVVKPSRWKTEKRENLRNVVNELEGRIAGKFSTFKKLSPIHFMHHNLSFEELLELYTASDVFIVSSLRDGMNLLPYQYISCQQENNGVLILSEFTGAAQCLDGSILINPWDADGFSDAIYKAVTMDEKLRKSNYQKLHNYVMKHTITSWGTNFIDKLKSIKGYCSQIVTPYLEINQIIKAANTSNKRVILLDYDKVLIATHKSAEPSNNIISIIKALLKKSNTYIYILSGHHRVNLDKQFESVGVGLSAEHGCFYKHPKCLQTDVNAILNLEGKNIIKEHNGWYRLAEHVDPALKEKVLHLFNDYKERTPGASIEEKEIGIIWHYRSGSEFGELGLWQTLDLKLI